MGEASRKLRFIKPKLDDGIYAIILKSDSFFYHRFYDEIDTICYCCHKHIQGRKSAFPYTIIENGKDTGNKELNPNGLEEVFFCSSDCKEKHSKDVSPYYNEGDFQERDSSWDNNYGYIYCIYNRAENKYYIGQTRYLPFFRWQEHIKSKLKGDITDLEFKVITTVKKGNEIDCQKKLNEIETWWIHKYLDDGYDTMNITKPHLSERDYKRKYDEMINKYQQTDIDFGL